MFSKRKAQKENEKDLTQNTQPALRDENSVASQSDESSEMREEHSESEGSEPQREQTVTDESETLRDETPSEEEETNSCETNTETETSEDVERESDTPLTDLERAYCLGAGLDESTLGKTKEILARMADYVNGKKFDPESLTMALKVLNFESEIEKAKEEGRTIGRNECMNEFMQTRRKAAQRASDLPHFRGTKGLGSPGKGNTIFDVARDAKN